MKEIIETRDEGDGGLNSQITLNLPSIIKEITNLKSNTGKKTTRLLNTSNHETYNFSILSKIQ